MAATCLSAQPLNYYFGNLHAHTSFSDGNRDSASKLISGPAASYNYAKLSSAFDFLGISEHNHFSTAKNPGFKRPLYQRGRRMADSLTGENFLCLFGMEYGVSSSNNGHVLIYGYDSLIGWESNVGGLSGPNYEVFNGKSDYAALFKKVARRTGAFGLLAHPYWTDFTTDGTDSTALAFAPYNATFDSAIVGMPLRSGNAFSVFEDYSDYSPLNYFNYYKKMLHQGYHLGIGYDHDNHFSNFGRSNGGRLVVLMPALTRQNFITAMKGQHFYGSDDSNARLDFRLNNNIMGTYVLSDAFPRISVQHSDPEGDQADTIRIWKGFRGSSSWAFTIAEFVGTDVCAYTDKSIISGREYYYFVELRQRDGQWMVSSPIWYTAGKLLGLYTPQIAAEVEWRYFPVQEELQFFNSLSQSAKVIVSSLSGVKVLEQDWSEAALRLTVSGLAEGFYLITIRTKTQNRIYKFLR